ncbi:MAG: Putative electron transport protein YccM [Prochlorococcus marinus str. MIT 9215]|nr:MAG: Putative electron transport protein YccM [Prochlorococcus marinus str. MIT 9215]
MESTVSKDCLLRMAPHLIGRPRRGVVGSSRYACKLRESIRQASNDRQRKPLLVSGEPGLEKDNIAQLVHFSSADRRLPLMHFDASNMHGDGVELFGREGSGEPSLLACLGDGNLLIDCIDLAEPQLRQRLIELAKNGHPDFSGRVMFTSESKVKELDGVVVQIRVPALRVRRSDLGEWLRYNVRLRSKKLGWEQPPELPTAVITRLQSHDFPNNLRELENVVERALRQTRRQAAAESGAGPSTQRNLSAALPEDVFWVNSREPSLRFDLWRWKPQLRQLMRSPKLWNGLLFGVVSWLFVVVNLWLWLGPQDRGHNSMLKFFWAWWWPLILLTYPLVGRLWCAFCPFMVWGQICQKGQIALSGIINSLGWPSDWLQPKPWPKGDHDSWGAPVLAAGFATILIWEEVWNLENTAWLSSCLLLVITAGAVICSMLFEKRFWCRYLCPVGGMNGLFAKLSILELRAQPGTCAGSCSSYACFKGGPAEGEGMATDGCPLGTHPAHLLDNRNCVLCMSCAQACPHRSVQLRLRPAAADLHRNMHATAGERGLILVLAGGIALHAWHRLVGWLPLAPESLQAGPILPRLAFAALALSLPAAIGLWINNRWLYASIPLLWSVLLARHLPMGMTEAGMVLPMGWPQWTADAHVIDFCQSMVIAIGWASCVVLLPRLIRRQRLSWITGSGVLLVAAVACRWVVQS